MVSRVTDVGVEMSLVHSMHTVSSQALRFPAGTLSAAVLMLVLALMLVPDMDS